MYYSISSITVGTSNIYSYYELPNDYAMSFLAVLYLACSTKKSRKMISIAITESV